VVGGKECVETETLNLKGKDMKTLWKDLIVYDDECRELGTLGEITQDHPEMVSVFNHPLDGWPGHFIAAEGEEPDWNTPKGEVDWEGFDEQRTI